MKYYHDLEKQLKNGFDQLSAGIPQCAPGETNAGPLTQEEKEIIFGVSAGRNSRRKESHTALFRYCSAAVFAVVFLVISTVFLVMGPGMDTVLQIQVNPSIEIRIRKGDVRKIKAKNEDAKPIIDGIDPKKGLDSVIDTILQRIRDGGYFDSGKNTVDISISGREADHL